VVEEQQMEQTNQLEIKQDIPFQQKTWTVQRVAWIILLVILGAGLLGLFGGTGLLAQASIGGTNDSLQIHYKRFTQYLSPTDMQIKIQLPTDTNDTLQLWIDRQYLDGFIVQNITPQPDKVEASFDHIIYEFAVAENTDTVTITLNIRHHRIGPLQGRIGLVDGQTLEFSQFVYP
jgi:hypothetical protein